MITFKKLLSEISINKSRDYSYRASLNSVDLKNQNKYLSIASKVTSRVDNKITDNERKIKNREKGMELALHKRVGMGRVPATEK